MKIFSKFKQFSREIKLIIITALIVSCVGVYAAGECIISATADDVTYNNTTVQVALDELYSMSQGNCPEGYECLRDNIYNAMAESAVLDNIASTYVTSSSGINFHAISSDTNGKGIYELASTQNDTYPIYYYRGAVDNNNIKFAGFCWKAIRTTDTGGVKMIYNGVPDGNGKCTNTTGTNTRIGTSPFNTNYSSASDVGYMYGTEYNYSFASGYDLSTAYIYGGDVTYSGGTYTLTNTMTSTGTWSNDYNTLNNHHYTCGTTGTTCTSVYYVYYTYTSGANYIILTNGKKIEDALDEMFNASNVNSTSSTAKLAIDTWYNNNLSSYSSYIEDTVYCNDRSIAELNGFDPNGGDMTKNMYFSPHIRIWSTFEPTLQCSRPLDRFTVSSSKGNGALTYPIGLITSDEMMYAGGVAGVVNNTYYLYSSESYWTASSYDVIGIPLMVYFDTDGLYGNVVSENHGLRPVISLNSASTIESGDGTATNPYVIQTS